MRIQNRMLAGCSLLTVVVACAQPEQDVPGVQVETSSSALVIGTVTTRSVVSTAQNLQDWARKNQIDPSIVAAKKLKVRYCAHHFPAGSPALANLQTAITAYNAVPGVSIDITDIAPQAGTEPHKVAEDVVVPTDTIFVDYSYQLKNPTTTWAGSLPFSCVDTAPEPKPCSRATLFLSGTLYTTDDDANLLDGPNSPSVGVFMHELGHIFGMIHNEPSPDSDDLSQDVVNLNNLWLDRTIVHGTKFQKDDFRSTVIHAATLAHLRAYYSDSSTGLATDEIVVHRNMTIADSALTENVEFNPSKSFIRGNKTLISAFNETKLRWNSKADNDTATPGAFEPCAAKGTRPRWFARMSETSTNQTPKTFVGAFQVTNSSAGTTWTSVAERSFDTHVAGAVDFRQIDWDRTFPLTASALGVAGGAGITTVTARKLRFKADPSGALVERNKTNNDWQVNLCLYPESDTTCQSTNVGCAQP